MGLLIRFNTEDFATKAEVREELAKAYPLHRVSAIINKDDKWEGYLERIPTRTAKPFPLDGLSDDAEKAPKDDGGDEGGLEEKPSDEEKPPKKKEEDGDEEKGGEKELDLPSLLGELKSLLEKIEHSVGGGPEDELAPVEPLDHPHVPPVPGGGPGSPKAGPPAAAPPGGVAPGGMPPPRKRPVPGGPIPVFTHQKETKIMECSRDVSKEEAIAAAVIQYPDYEITDMQEQGNRWVARMVLREVDGDSSE